MAVLVGALVLASCASPPERPAPVIRDDRTTVHFALVRLAAAVRESDLGAILDGFTAGAVLESAGSPPIRGRLPIGEAFARTFERRRTFVRIHVDYLSVRGSAAYCRGTIASTPAYRREPDADFAASAAATDPTHERFRMLLRHDGRAWRIARWRIRPERPRDHEGAGILAL